MDSFIYYTTRLFFLFEIFFAFSFLVKLLFLLFMKTNIFLMTGICDNKYPTARKSHNPLTAQFIYLALSAECAGLINSSSAVKGLRNITIFCILGSARLSECVLSYAMLQKKVNMYKLIMKKKLTKENNHNNDYFV